MIRHRLHACDPYFYSNDHWDPEVVKDLNDRLASLSIPKEKGAALVIGAGSLPFTLDRLPHTIIAADRHSRVAHQVAQRCLQVQSCTSWYDYADKFIHTRKGTQEFAGALSSGLAGSIWDVQDASKLVDVVPYPGDIIANTTSLAALVREHGRQFTFINFTNVADYVEPVTHESPRFLDPGGSVLAQALGKLPVHDDAVICDSHGRLAASLFSPDQYVAVHTLPYDETLWQ